MTNDSMFIVEIAKKIGFADPFADGLSDDIRDLGIEKNPAIKINNIYWLTGDIVESEVKEAAEELLCDAVVEQYFIGLTTIDDKFKSFLVGFHPGVTDPAGESATRGIRELGVTGIKQVKTGKRFMIADNLTGEEFELIRDKLLMNKVIQREMKETDNPFPSGISTTLVSQIVPILDLDSDQLDVLSKNRVLALNRNEMQVLQNHFRKLDRNPSDVELETLAQTWSEHCIHKTLKSDYIVNGKEKVENLLKSTIVAATEEINHPMCVSV
ncbi:phosphoribosylformylglycinamidine synthase subunit PurS, partial [bacterium]|nr:phosphoribosylformylglycinamidine synthase subunit PurS [bacterium]MBU1025532.1 phosphoribosylformylglycinamidine synthase subunit PurS [bacterium]